MLEKAGPDFSIMGWFKQGNVEFFSSKDTISKFEENTKELPKEIGECKDIKDVERRVNHLIYNIRNGKDINGKTIRGVDE